MSVWFGDLRIVVLLASTHGDLQQELGRFTAECEVVRRTVSFLWVRSELLPQVKDFKYLGVLCMSTGKLHCEVDRWIGAASAVMQVLYWTEKKAEPEGNAVNLLVGLCTKPHLCSGGISRMR